MSSSSSSKEVKKPAGPYLHIENIQWLARDFANDDRVAWLFEEKNKPYLKYGGIALLAVYLVFGHLGQLISNLVGFLYPAYCSVQALESSSKADDTRWLTYWVVFSAFTLVDTFSGFLISWIPFYWLAKVLFLVWCFSSSDLNGSDIIYKKIILPFFKKNEKKFDMVMNRVGKAVKDVTTEAERLTENVRTDL